MVAVLDPVNQPNVCDSALIELIDSANYVTVFCAYTLVSTDGYGTCVVPALYNNRIYFASIKFKNTFHLLTKNSFLLNGQPLSFDLTVPQNTCCNFDTANGVVKAYSGDVNNDFNSDILDLSIIDADITSMATGYQISDLNGDGVVDNVDYAICDNNSANFRYDDYPYACNPALLGIEEGEETGVSIYPNPSENYFRVKAEGTFSDFKIVMFDELGRPGLSEKFSDVSDMEVNVNHLPAGIYYIQMTSGNLFWNKKVVVLRSGND
jgi:hypothetical protein